MLLAEGAPGPDRTAGRRDHRRPKGKETMRKKKKVSLKRENWKANNGGIL